MAQADDQEGGPDQQQANLDDSGGMAEVVGEAFELWREGLPGPGEVRSNARAGKAFRTFYHEAADEFPFVLKFLCGIAGFTDPGELRVVGARDRLWPT